MADCASPTITIRATNEAQRLSDTDDRPWQAIYLRRRQTNTGEAHVGGPEVTATTGGAMLGGPDGDIGFWFTPSDSREWRLTNIYVAGQKDDVLDTICKPFG